MAGLMMMAASLSFQSCTKDEKQEKPVFPEAVTINAEPGEDIEINVSPNLDWSVSLPVSESRYFWIKDSGSDEKLFTLNGKKGDNTITIGVSDELDVEAHTAELTMKMGGESQVIAILTLGKLPDPNFPEKEESTVEPGGKYAFEIEPNQAWTVSVPSSDSGTEYFWLEKDGEKVFSISGIAGKHTVTLCVADKKDMEEHKVDVTMTMGGQSAVIRTYTLEADKPVFELSIAKCTEVDFVGGTDGFKYTYDDPIVIMGNEAGRKPELDLVWPAAASSYMHNIKVYCNYSWEVRDDAEWLFVSEPDRMNKVGLATEFQIYTSPDNYPSEATSANLVIRDPSGKVDSVFTIKVNFPDMKRLVRFGGMIKADSEIKFNQAGWYFVNDDFYEDAEAKGTVSSTSEMKFYYLVTDNYGGMAAFDASQPVSSFAWLHVDYDWAIAKGNPLKKADYTITVAENEDGIERVARLFAIPSAVLPENFLPARDLFNSDRTDINPEYAEFEFISVKQEGASSSDEFSLSVPDGAGIPEGDNDGNSYFKFEDLSIPGEELDPDLEPFMDILEAGGKVYRISYWKPELQNPASNGFYFNMTGTYTSLDISEKDKDWLSAEYLEDDYGPLGFCIDMGKAGEGVKKGSIVLLDGEKRIGAVICVKGY